MRDPAYLVYGFLRIGLAIMSFPAPLLSTGGLLVYRRHVRIPPRSRTNLQNYRRRRFDFQLEHRHVDWIRTSPIVIVLSRVRFPAIHMRLSFILRSLLDTV